MNEFVTPEEVELPRVTKGRRPSFFDDPAIDQMMTFMLEVMTELAVVRERVDTIERLLDSHGSISRDQIEAFHPDDHVVAQRTAWREAYVARILRLHIPQPAS